MITEIFNVVLLTLYLQDLLLTSDVEENVEENYYIYEIVFGNST